MHLFSLFTHTKVAKVVLSGEPDHSQLFGFLLKGFLFFINYFPEKEGYLILRVEYNLKVSRIYYFPLKKKE
jgi:hypothetical protein